MITSPTVLARLLRFVAHFHQAQALLWQQQFSLERNECANVLQVGFIKVRPGTVVLARYNYHVTKAGSGEIRTLGQCQLKCIECTRNGNTYWKRKKMTNQCNCMYPIATHLLLCDCKKIYKKMLFHQCTYNVPL